MKPLKLNNNSYATIELFDNIEDCSNKTANYLKNIKVALSGGTTYRKLFSLWSTMNLDFKFSSFYPVDERVVPFNDPQSNWGMIHQNFLKPIGLENQKSHFSESVNQYIDLLKNKFRSDLPTFDTIFLGVGDEGHTASLFPGNNYLNDNHSIVLSTTSPKPPFERITLGPKVLSEAKNLIVVILGDNKKEVVEQILNRNLEMPIVKILSLREKSTIYIQQSLFVTVHAP